MTHQFQYLQAMGIQAWQLREDSVVTESAQVVSVTTSLPALAAPERVIPESEISCLDVSGLGWSKLETAVNECQLCELHRSRTRTVFGAGSQQADWLVIGEAPSQEEEQEANSFVGRDGQLLDAMLQAIGLKRGQVFITNSLKCRPPDDRDPSAAELACCDVYLMRQITLLQPKIILAVGRIAAQNLLKTSTSISALRGEVHTYGTSGIAVVATYHPAYLLRKPSEKRKVWQDLQLAVATLEQASV